MIDEIRDNIREVNRHAERLRTANFLKKGFIKKNIKIKFESLSQKISGIARIIETQSFMPQRNSGGNRAGDEDILNIYDKLNDIEKRVEENRNTQNLNEIALKTKVGLKKQAKSEFNEASVKLRGQSKLPPRRTDDEYELSDKKLEQHQVVCLEADCHFFGHGTPKDIQRAVFFYAKAIKHGSSKASLALGKIFEEGDGLEQDLGEAYRLYSSVQDQEPYALYCLGRMWEEGTNPESDGTPNIKTAYVYYVKAMEGGCTVAANKVAEMLMDNANKDIEHNAQEAKAILENL